MSLHRCALFLAVLFSLVGGTTASVPLGHGSELFVTSKAGLRADDNVFLARDNEQDLILDFVPGLDLKFGEKALIQGSVTLIHTFSLYSRNSDLNTNLFNGDFGLRYDDGKSKRNFRASFIEVNQNSIDNRGLTRRDEVSTSGDFELSLTQVSSAAAGVSFNRTDYKRRSYTDSASLSLPLTYYYKVTEKLDLSFGYRHREYRVDLGEDSTDLYFNVGSRGSFTPKLTGTFTLGHGRRKLELSRSRTLLGTEASLQYELSPKTNVQWNASNDFGTSPQGIQQKVLATNATISAKILSNWLGIGGIGWRNVAYARSGAIPASSGDFWELQLGASYIVSASLRIDSGYIRRDYFSSIAANEFKSNILNFSGSFRF